MAEARSPISPTAHYTGEVWTRNGLSHPALGTAAGRLMFESMRVPMAATKALGGTTLEEMLLARHVLIDRVLEEAIERGDVSQVVEIAAGLSPRGWRFSQRYGDLVTYIETDLPEMAGRKRRALEEAGSLGPDHRVVVLDALREEGPDSLAAVAAGLDPQRGVALITEGLLSYLGRDAVVGLWRRAARAISPFPHGLYVSELHLAGENAHPTITVGTRLLSLFVRGRVEMHFDDEAEAIAVLTGAGFARADLHRGSEVLETEGARNVRVIEALT
jgi:O-methyltransferase involved in polyketide biosynthesis